jgi:hypothetical protein
MNECHKVQMNDPNVIRTALLSLPTPELIAVSNELISQHVEDAIRFKWMKQAFAGAIAAEKCLYYLEWLREIERHRRDLGKRISMIQKELEESSESDFDHIATLDVTSTKLSGMQEVSFHLFASCVSQIERLLPTATRVTGTHIASDDRSLLRSFTILRNYFEHLDQRLPGRKFESASVTESRNNDEWHVKMAIPMDEQGRILLDGQTIVVSSRGVLAVESLVEKCFTQMRQDALGSVAQYFEKHPESVPTIDELRGDLLMSTGNPRKS